MKDRSKTDVIGVGDSTKLQYSLADAAIEGHGGAARGRRIDAANPVLRERVSCANPTHFEERVGARMGTRMKGG